MRLSARAAPPTRSVHPLDRYKPATRSGYANIYRFCSLLISNLRRIASACCPAGKPPHWSDAPARNARAFIGRPQPIGRLIEGEQQAASERARRSHVKEARGGRSVKRHGVMLFPPTFCTLFFRSLHCTFVHIRVIVFHFAYETVPICNNDAISDVYDAI